MPANYQVGDLLAVIIVEKETGSMGGEIRYNQKHGWCGIQVIVACSEEGRA